MYPLFYSLKVSMFLEWRIQRGVFAKIPMCSMPPSALPLLAAVTVRVQCAPSAMYCGESMRYL